MLPSGLLASPSNGEEEHKVWICHATASEQNPWEAIEVDEEGWNGHDDHEEDFEVGDENEDGVITDADCTDEGDGEDEMVEICHLTGLEDPFYEIKTVTEEEAVGHFAHGDVATDEGECPGRGGGVVTPPPVTLSPIVTRAAPVVLEGFGGGAPTTLPVTGADPITMSFLYATMLMTVISALKIAKEEA